MAVHAAPMVIIGEINLNLDDQSASSTISFTSILSGADLVQHIVGPTYRAGHKLDAVITQSSTPVIVVVESPTISDHSLVVSVFLLGSVLNHVWVNLPFSSGTGRRSTTTLSGTIYSRRLSSRILPTMFLHYSTRTTGRFVRWSACTSRRKKSSIANVHLRLGSIIAATRRRLSDGDLSVGTDARITAMTFACGAPNWTSNRNMRRFGRGL